jgi:aspartate/glutamate racemase
VNKTIGIVGTNGVYKTEVYNDLLENRGFEVIYPSEEL